MKKIILITGGQSSGKSLHAEHRALELSPEPVYVATARVGMGDTVDDEMAERVRRHRERRGPGWTTVEEPLHLGDLELTGRVVLVDCVTLWLSNLLFDLGADTSHLGADTSHLDADAARLRAEEEFERFTAHDAAYIFVTGEVGLGGVAANPLARAFADLQGAMNQYIAARADEVTLVVSGIPLKIK